MDVQDKSPLGTIMRSLPDLFRYFPYLDFSAQFFPVFAYLYATRMIHSPAALLLLIPFIFVYAAGYAYNNLIDREDPNALRVKASVGYGEVEKLRIKMGEGVTGRAAQTGQPILVEDVRRNPSYIPGVTGGRCEICAPIHIKGRIAGVLYAESVEEKAFDESDLELLSIFAAHAAAAIQNARLITELEKANETLTMNLRELERLNMELDTYAKQIAMTNEALAKQVRQLTALHQAGLAITSSLDLDTTLERIVRMVGDLVETSTTTIKLLDSETKEMKVRIQSGEETRGESGP